MHKKLEADLVSIAHKILQMKNRDEVIALRDKAQEVYEKLSLLAFVDEYLEATPNADVSKDEILKKIDKAVANIKKDTPEIKQPKAVQDTIVEKADEVVQKQTENEVKPKEDKTIFEPKFDSVKIDIQSLKENQISSKEEFRDAISADKTATLFEDDDASKEKKTLNDKLFKGTIQVGLNDRIAFVNNLFNYNQADFNRVLSQLNTLKTEQEAKAFIHDTIKPEYNWEGKEAYEERFMALIERRFA